MNAALQVSLPPLVVPGSSDQPAFESLQALHATVGSLMLQAAAQKLLTLFQHPILSIHIKHGRHEPWRAGLEWEGHDVVWSESLDKWATLPKWMGVDPYVVATKYPVGMLFQHFNKEVLVVRRDQQQDFLKVVYGIHYERYLAELRQVELQQGIDHGVMQAAPKVKF